MKWTADNIIEMLRNAGAEDREQLQNALLDGELLGRLGIDDEEAVTDAWYQLEAM